MQSGTKHVRIHLLRLLARKNSPVVCIPPISKNSGNNLHSNSPLNKFPEKYVNTLARSVREHLYT